MHANDYRMRKWWIREMMEGKNQNWHLDNEPLGATITDCIRKTTTISKSSNCNSHCNNPPPSFSSHHLNENTNKFHTYLSARNERSQDLLFGWAELSFLTSALSTSKLSCLPSIAAEMMEMVRVRVRGKELGATESDLLGLGITFTFRFQPHFRVSSPLSVSISHQRSVSTTLEG